MAFYKPNQVPFDAKMLPQFLATELANIALASQNSNQYALLEMQYAEPKKKRDGMIVLADGVTWNPGSGAGYYGYRASAWRFLG
jgi:hypothetical protein